MSRKGIGKNDLIELAEKSGIRHAATTLQHIVPSEQEPQCFNTPWRVDDSRSDSAAISACADLGFVQPVTNSTAWQKCRKQWPTKPTNGSAKGAICASGLDVALVGTGASIDALATSLLLRGAGAGT
jgi:hypothetical protein